MTYSTQSTLRSDFAVVQQQDRAKYHGGPDGSQIVGPIGILNPAGNLCCVGCWFCSGTFADWAAMQK
jgi:hypothetical protein